MIELFIEENQIHLSSQAVINIVSRNPFLTKEGEFSFDIDISLQAEENRRAYANIDRINNTVDSKKDRSVVLYANGKLLLTGTEVILESSASSVKIQILSGNSELNYKMKDVYIRNMDMGTFEFNPGDAAEANVSATGPCCFPLVLVKDESATILRNNFTRRYLVGPLFDLTPVGALPPASALVPQLYMGRAVVLILRSLGYTVRKNIFSTDERLKYLVVANGNHTTRFNEMLPNMSVNDFISAIEEAFSVYFSVDYTTREIDIVRFDSYIKNREPKQIEIVDDFVIGNMDENEVYTGYAFKDDGSNYHKRMILKDPDILKKERVEFSSFSSLVFSIEESGIENLYNANYLYYVRSEDTHYYIAKENNRFILSKIGVFTDTSEGEKRELSCVPCSCSWHTVDFRVVVENKPSWDVVWNTDIDMYVPCVTRTLSSTDQFIDDAVMNGIRKEDKSDVINTFFYTGEKQVELHYGMSSLLTVYPFAFEDWTDCVCRTHSVDYSAKVYKWASMIFDYSRKLTFRPGEYANIIEEYVDNEKEYKFRVLGENLNPDDIVNIRNKLFVCKETTSEYRENTVERSGVFHALKRS